MTMKTIIDALLGAPACTRSRQVRCAVRRLFLPERSYPVLVYLWRDEYRRPCSLFRTYRLRAEVVVQDGRSIPLAAYTGDTIRVAVHDVTGIEHPDTAVDTAISRTLDDVIAARRVGRPVMAGAL